MPLVASCAGGSATAFGGLRTFVFGPPAGDAGFLMASWSNVMDISFSTTGTVNSFGDLSTASGIGGSQPCGGVCSATRLVILGGYNQPTGASKTTIWYSDIATRNTGASFGSLSVGIYSGGQCNTSTRGLAFVGYAASGGDMQYITIATTGNSTFFGYGRQMDYINGCLTSATRGLSWGSQYGGQNPWIDYVTMASTGNYTNFGSMTQASNQVCTGASTTRGMGVGILYNSYPNQTNEYVTIASTGNSAAFGNLGVKTNVLFGCAKASSIFVVAGGYNSSSVTLNTISYFTIATTGNSTSWGTLANAAAHGGASGTISNCHGGN